MTAPRIHLLESDSALKEGTDLVPMCELDEPEPVKVPKAYFLMSYEARNRHQGRSSHQHDGVLLEVHQET